jgi:hypothetical protein
MKKSTYTTAIFMAMVATTALAHHPSEGISPNFDIVDAQLEAVESPHLDMDMDAMGATTAAGDSVMSTAAQEQAGWQANQAGVSVPDVEAPMDAASGAGTIDLMENVAE